MIKRIRELHPLPEYRLFVVFDDAKQVIYDMNDDIRTLPNYILLREIEGLFQNVQLDESRTCVYWTDDIDLPSDVIYEYGESVA